MPHHNMFVRIGHGVRFQYYVLVVSSSLDKVVQFTLNTNVQIARLEDKRILCHTHKVLH